MKRESMRNFVALCMALLLIFTMSACSTTDEEPVKEDLVVSDTTKNDTVETPEKEADVTSDNDVNNEPFVFTVWGDPVHNNDPFKDDPTPEGKKILDYIQAKMEEKFPNIEIQYVNKGWGDELRQNLMIATMAGLAPDIASGEDFVPEFARNDALLELPSDIALELAQGAITGGMHNGQLYAVSGVTGIFALTYNKDVLTKAGLTEADVPTTWSEWLDVSAKITEAGNGEFYGTVVQNNQLGGAYRIAPFIRQVGGDFATDDWQNTAYNTPEVLEALTFLRALSKTAPPGSQGLNDEGAIYKMINDGTACFYVNGSWFDGWVKGQDTPGNIGYAPLPIPDGKGGPANVTVGNVLWYGLKSTNNEEAAIEYLRIMASEAYQKQVCILTSRIPSNVKVAADPEYREAAADLIAFAEIMSNEPASPLPILPKDGAKIWEAWYRVQDVTFVSDNSIEEVLENAQGTAEELLK